MSFYEDLVMHAQMNYSKYYKLYAQGQTPYELSDKREFSYALKRSHTGNNLYGFLYIRE